MNKWMKTYWRKRKQAKFKKFEEFEIAYAVKIGDVDAQLAVVNENGTAIQYIENPSEAVQLAAVNNDGYNAIRHIIDNEINPSEAVQLAAVNNNGYAIQYIENPSEAVQLAVVNNNGEAIKLIVQKGIEPSEAVQLAAVNNDGYAIQYIKNPSKNVQLAAQQQRDYFLRV